MKSVPEIRSDIAIIVRSRPVDLIGELTMYVHAIRNETARCCRDTAADSLREFKNLLSGALSIAVPVLPVRQEPLPSTYVEDGDLRRRGREDRNFERVADLWGIRRGEHREQTVRTSHQEGAAVRSRKNVKRHGGSGAKRPNRPAVVNAQK